MADSFKNLWKEVDAFANKSKADFTRADEEIKKVPGWKFKGCPDGVIWRAYHASSRTEVTARTADELIAKVRANS